jgi:glycosyltransferase involved in cell wall biosynthesis
MRIGHVIFARPEMTGRDIVVSQLVCAQAEADRDAVILLAAGSSHYIDQMVGSSAAHLRFPTGHTLTGWLRSAWRYSQLDPRQLGVTLLHGHGCRSIFLLATLKIARRPGWLAMPVVYSNYGFFNDSVLHRISTWTELLTARWADAITVSSADSRRYMLGKRHPVRVSVIPNGTSMPANPDRPGGRTPSGSLAAQYRVPANAPTVGIVGRISREKRVDVFIKACTYISARRPDTHFFVIGTGPDDSTIRQLAESSGLDHIHITGHYPDISDVYGSLDVLVHAADFEGLPLVILEAMSSGVAVVATAVGGIRELIRHGDNGLLADRRDPHGLANGVLALLADPELSRSVAQAAQRTVREKHTIETMRQAVADLYATVPAKT